MTNIFKLKARGLVTMRLGRTPRLVFEQKRNTITGQAKEIAAKRLIQHPSSVIDKINFYQGATLLFSAPITASSIIAPQQVQFDANVAEADFEGVFDKVTLQASGIGAFAELTGINVDKSIVEPLLVNWTIKIL